MTFRCNLSSNISCETSENLVSNITTEFKVIRLLLIKFVTDSLQKIVGSVKSIEGGTEPSCVLFRLVPLSDFLSFILIFINVLPKLLFLFHSCVNTIYFYVKVFGYDIYDNICITSFSSFLEIISYFRRLISSKIDLVVSLWWRLALDSDLVLCPALYAKANQFL